MRKSLPPFSPAVHGRELLTLAFLCLATNIARADVFTDLTERGVSIGSGQVVRLPKPALPDGLSPAEQQEALRKAAGKYPLDRFVKDSSVAPFVLEITSIDNPAGRRDGQRVDFYFVAYGTLEAIVDKDLITDLAGSQEPTAPDAPPPAARVLSPAELKARGLTPQKTADVEESYLAIDVPILDRVQLGGVGLGVEQRTAESITGALRLDERFHDDSQFPNRWRPIERDKLGKATFGPPQPYAGLGAYVKLTRLAEPAGAVFIECHIVFDEPQGWFDGKNLLRSKLPLVVQENARTFRRKLAKASQ